MSFEEQFDDTNNQSDHFEFDTIDGFDMNHDVNEGEEYTIKLEEQNEEGGVVNEKPAILETIYTSSDEKNGDEDSEREKGPENESKVEEVLKKEEVKFSSRDSSLDLARSTGIDAKSLEEPDQSSSESRKVFDFKSFLNFLKDPKAEPILKYTRSFINQVLKSERWYSFKEQKKLTQDFEEFICQKFAIYEPFKLMDGADLNNCKDCMEKLITNKLYAKIFPPLYYNRYVKLSKMNQSDSTIFPEDHLELIKCDQKIWSNITNFGSIITLENLEVHNLTEVNSDMLQKFFKVFNRELWKMGKFRSPRDKLVCLLNSCKIIFSYLKTIGNKSLTADDFMPLLIYSILKLPTLDSDNYYLQSTVSYIENFRQASFLKGEESYYLMSFQGALQFVSELNEETMFEKFKVHDDEEFTNKLNERKGWIAAKQLEKEDQIKQKKREKRLKEKPEQNQPASSSWPLSDWFGGSSPMDKEDSLLTKFSNLMSKGAEQEKDILDDDIDEEKEAKVKKRTVNSDLETQQLIENQIKQSEIEDLKSLKDLFPQLDELLLKDIYVSKNRNVTQTIEIVLEMV